MLLKNFRGLIPLLGASSSNYTADIARGLRATTGEYCVDGIAVPNFRTPIYILDSKEYNSTPNKADNSATFCFAFGTGDIPPTIDDYKLSGDLVGTDVISFSATADSVYPTYSTNKLSFSASIINDSASPVTIKEIGIVCRVLARSSSYTSGAILLTRDVLPEPVILNTGDSKVFEISIDTMSFVEQQVLQGDN